GSRHAARSLLHHLDALGHEIQCRHGQYQAQTCQRWRRTNEGRFQLKPLGCIVQKVLRTINPQAIFLKGLHVRWFVTEDIPSVLALPCWRHGQRHWAIMLCRAGDLVPAIRLPPGHGEPLARTAAMAASIEPKAALDADPPMPAHPLEMGPQLCL